MEKTKRLGGKFWLALTIFSLMGQVAWVVENMFLNVFIYKSFAASETSIGIMVAASAVTATLTTVFMGALSDRIGKRRLFICGGYILWGISIFCFVFIRNDIINSFIPATISAATVGISLTIICDCLMTFFGSTANDAAFNAWLTDSTDTSNRGKAEGINAMMPLIAVLAVFGGSMIVNDKNDYYWTVIFSVIGGLTLIIGILGFFFVKEPKLEKTEMGYWESIIYGFKPSTIKSAPVLYIALAAFIVFNISIQIFMPYLIIYYEQTLQIEMYALIMAPAIILASVVTVIWGKLYDKKGFTLTGLLSVLMLIIGYLILFFTRHVVPVFIGSFFMMSGYLSGMAAFGALIRDNMPQGKAGCLQGVRIFSQVLVPGIIGPTIGSTVLKLTGASKIEGTDGRDGFIPNASIFITAAIAVLPVLIVFFVLENRKFRKKAAKEIINDEDIEAEFKE